MCGMNLIQLHHLKMLQGFVVAVQSSAFQQVMNLFRSRSTSRLSALPDVTNMKIQGCHAAGCGGRF